MPYLYHTEEDQRAMLERVGVETVDDLFDQIPEKFAVRDPLAIGAGKSEPETQRELAHMAAKNHPAAGMISFLGGGVYDHHVPSVVRNLASRPEFATAYTPYQPEVSQGTLQVIFEFQTHISRLTGMDVANASMYDGATALAEACLMAAKIKRRDKVLYAGALHPRYLAVVDRYLAGQSIALEAIPYDEDAGDIDTAALEQRLADDVAAVVVQTPNYFGVLERPWAFEQNVHDHGSLLIAVVDPVSLSIIKPPGDWGADIVVGEGQSLGNDMNFGGPLLGFMACRDPFIRQMPGRIVSATTDADGREAFVLTLQTREQHIRREKATSNICTNQGLLATRATIYLSLLGEEGFTQLGGVCCARATELAKMVAAIDGFRIAFAGPFFREFVVHTPRSSADIVAAARKEGILAGVPLERYFGGKFSHRLLVAVTEKHTSEDLQRYCDLLSSLSP
jgi:glycine dehydrogenase subunit 1